jgi:Zn-dependent protease
VPSVKLSPTIVSVCVVALYVALVTMRTFGLSAAIEVVHIASITATKLVSSRALTRHLFREGGKQSGAFEGQFSNTGAAARRIECVTGRHLLAGQPVPAALSPIDRPVAVHGCARSFSAGGCSEIEPAITGSWRLESAQACYSDVSLLDVAQIFIAFIVLLFSLTVHEAAHAWTADRLGDSTAKLLGRISLNPIVHIDLIGTVVLPLVALASHTGLIGWAKPVPVDTRQLRHPRRDYILVAAAGPASNLLIAIAAALILLMVPVSPQRLDETNVSVPIAIMLGQLMRLNVLLAVFNMLPIPPLDGGSVLAGLLPYSAAQTFNRIRPYGFMLLYVLVLSGGFNYLVIPPYEFIVSWLPSK